jgi:hypothetical protein
VKPTERGRESRQTAVHVRLREPGINVECFRVENASAGPEFHDQTVAHDNGADGNGIPKRAEGGDSFHKLRRVPADHADRGLKLATKLVLEAPQELPQGRLVLDHRAKARVSNWRERGMGRLNGAIDLHIGQRPNGRPVGGSSHWSDGNEGGTVSFYPADREGASARAG